MKKLISLLKNSSGSSMMFVLGVMLLLLSVGTSALIAAGANSGAGNSKRISNQLNIYADSMQKSIRHSIFSDEKDTDIENTVTLGGQILREAYKNPGSDVTLNITPTLSGAELQEITEVTIDVVHSTIITPFEPEQPELTEEIRDDDGSLLYSIVVRPETPRKPQTASINGMATVTVRAEYQNSSIVSVAVYNLSGAYLKDDGNENNMIIEVAGDWRFISYDKAER